MRQRWENGNIMSRMKTIQLLCMKFNDYAQISIQIIVGSNPNAVELLLL